MLHHAHNHDQVDHQHEDNRNQCGLDKCIRIPDRVIRWQTVTVVIHRHNNIFKHRIAEYISDNRSQQCYNNRHGQIVPHQLSLRVTGRAQRSDRGGLFAIVLLIVTAKINAMITTRISSSTPPMALSDPISSVAKLIAGFPYFGV